MARGWELTPEGVSALYRGTAALLSRGSSSAATRVAALDACAAAARIYGGSAEAGVLEGAAAVATGGLWAAVGDASSALRAAAVGFLEAAAAALGGARLLEAAAAADGEAAARLREALESSAATERLPSVRAKAQVALGNLAR